MAIGSDNSTKPVIVAISANAVVTVFKFLGWIFSGSPSMLAESIHSVADTTNQALLYVGIRHGARGASRQFPLGQGHARYVWNLVSAMGIFFVGFGVTTYHGVASLFHPHESGSANPWIPIAVLALAFVIEGYALLVALKQVNRTRGDRSFLVFMRETDDPTIVGVVLEDSIAILGVVFALVGVGLSQLFGTHLPDSIASIVIGVLLGLMAVIFALVNGRLLIGRAATLAKETEIRDYLLELPSIDSVPVLKTQILGPGKIQLTLEVEFHGEILIDREVIKRDAKAIREGEDPAPILVSSSERMVRIVGAKINELELGLKEAFPSIDKIDLEVN